MQHKKATAIAPAKLGKYETSDEKPVEGVPNGSDFYELDGNHDVYIFDGDTREWVLQ